MFTIIIIRIVVRIVYFVLDTYYGMHAAQTTTQSTWTYDDGTRAEDVGCHLVV